MFYWSNFASFAKILTFAKHENRENLILRNSRKFRETREHFREFRVSRKSWKEFRQKPYTCDINFRPAKETLTHRNYSWTDLAAVGSLRKALQKFLIVCIIRKDFMECQNMRIKGNILVEFTPWKMVLCRFLFFMSSSVVFASYFNLIDGKCW